jgi:hypothetical protein
VPNICVFCDDSVHDDPAQVAYDVETRRELVNHSYCVNAIRYYRIIEEQIAAQLDIIVVH